MDAPQTKAEVEQILATLEKKDGSSSSQVLDGLLKQLHNATKIRPDTVLEPLYAKRGVRILGLYAFDSSSKPEHLPALRCLNNVLVRSIPSRQFLSSEIGASKIVSLLKRNDPEDELAVGNIIILSCHGTDLDLGPSFENDGLGEAMNAIIIRNVKNGTLPTPEPTSGPLASLRLLSTLGARYESYAGLFLDSVEPMLEMLSKMTILSPPLQAPVSYIVNCLAMLPVDQARSVPLAGVDKLVEVLKNCISHYGALDKDGEFLPLLFSFHKLSQSRAAEAKSRLKECFLPTDDDRTQVLGRGESLPHKLLSMTNNSMFSEVREVVMSIFFELSDQNPTQFVHNVGFGNAAGYLSSKGIQISQQDLETDAAGPEVNPITGQRIDAEPDVPLPDMTDEEKEREAERLFVLFERLKATGVVDVENPVVQAAREGRIQELPDSDSSDDEAKK